MSDNQVTDLHNDSVILHDSAKKQWRLFEHPEHVIIERDPSKIQSRIDQVEKQVEENGLTAVGFITYEAASANGTDAPIQQNLDFPLLWFGLYQSSKPYHFPKNPGTTKTPAIKWQASVSDQDYRQAIDRIHTEIHEGNTYQVNYTYRLQARIDQTPWHIFTRLIHAQGAAYGAYIQTQQWSICSASPELFFTLDGDKLTSRPMKGTAERGLTSEDDLAQKRWLQNSIKNRAENLMIVDMVRNDFGRICEIGSITVPHLFSVEQYPTVWQMTSTITGTTKLALRDIFNALFPAASITGAPKRSAMEIIDNLEPTPRKLYTGTIGYFSPKRQAQFNIAIRTLLFNNQTQQAEYSVGSGITSDSNAREEHQECRAKALILNHSLADFKLIETLRWAPEEGIYLLERHMQRLLASARYFAWQIKPEAILAELQNHADTLDNTHNFIIRLLIDKKGKTSIESRPLNPLPEAYSISLATTPIKKSSVFMYHKTTRRGVYERALAGVTANDAILFNEQGEITESTIANIIVEIGQKLYTPPIECGLLSGIYRAELLSRGEIQERLISLQEYQQAENVYLINSVRKKWRVNRS